MADVALQESIARVEREREAHEIQDVLGESWKLKRRFPHSLDNPARNALRDRFHSFLYQSNKSDVLDFGCGRGEYAREAARAGARVVGIDISEPYIQSASAAMINESIAGAADFRVMDAHYLDFPDNSFDLVIGNGILHHLDVERALSEIRRVLKPGGAAVFQEPLADNPLLKLFRSMTPRARTVDEAPFTRRDLEKMSAGWVSENEYFGIVSAPISIITSILFPKFPDNLIARIGYMVERSINNINLLDSWNQYVLIHYKKPEH